MNPQRVSALIKNIRKENGLTQQQLANELGVTYQAVSKWENKKNSPDTTTLQLLSDKYKVDINQVFSSTYEARRIGRLNRLVAILCTIFLVAVAAVPFLVNRSAQYEFTEVSTSSKDFSLNGVIAASHAKSSIYISNVKTTLDDPMRYTSLKATLFETDGTRHTELTRCSDISSQPTEECRGSSLEELLGSMKFYVDDLPQTLSEDLIEKLYIEIDAVNTEGNHINFKLPLTIKS